MVEDEPVSQDPTDAKPKPGHDEQFCTSCGEIIKKQAEICPSCGVRLAKETSKSERSNDKSPGVAFLLAFVSFLFPIVPGAGQMYNDEVGKGIVFSVIQWFNLLLIGVLVGFVTYPLFGIIVMYDAYAVAK